MKYRKFIKGHQFTYVEESKKIDYQKNYFKIFWIYLGRGILFKNYYIQKIEAMCLINYYVNIQKINL